MFLVKSVLNAGKNTETLERIEEIIQKVKGMLTEIAVVDYKQTA